MLLAECFGGIASSPGCVALALSPRLREIARCEHARRSIRISIESFGFPQCRRAGPRARASNVHCDP
jgi:hypothetical protein